MGQTREQTVSLTAGNYVLVCKIYDATEKEAHYKLGIRIGFEVSG